MRFLWREALWLLLALPALVGTYAVLLRRRKKEALRYASLTLLREELASAPRIRPHVPPLIFVSSLIALVVAIGRPVAVMPLPSEQRTVVLAIDVSYSMAATDVQPSRLAAAQAAAKAFVRAQPRDVRVGILAFAGDADLAQAPTANRENALAAIDRLELGHSTALGTAVIASLLTIFPSADIAGNYDIFGMGRSPVALRAEAYKAEKRLFQSVPPGSDSSAAIILLTDGRSTMGVAPAKAAQLAADRGIRVFTVGFGTPEGGTIQVQGRSIKVDLDEATLKDIAGLTGGKYFRAGTAEELKKIYQSLNVRAALDHEETELTALFIALAAVLALASAVLSFAWSNRLI